MDGWLYDTVSETKNTWYRLLPECEMKRERLSGHQSSGKTTTIHAADAMLHQQATESAQGERTATLTIGHSINR